MGRSSAVYCGMAALLAGSQQNNLLAKIVLENMAQQCFRLPAVKTPQAFGKVPGMVRENGEAVLGKFGVKTRDKLGDVVRRDLGEIRNSAAKERRDIIENFNSFSNPQQGRNYLSNEYNRLTNEVADLKEQMSLYGPHSTQGRVIKGVLKSKLNSMSAIEGLNAGTLNRVEGSTRRHISKSYDRDYNYTPQDGVFGNRIEKGKMTSVDKAKMKEFQANNKRYYSDRYDSLKTVEKQNNSIGNATRQQIWNEAQQNINHYAWQRDLYRGTDWKPTLDREITRNLKLMKEVSRQDSRYQVNRQFVELVSPSLQREAGFF